ncbi:OFA family MFS transporter [Polymorphobacter sp. PAMC 29334]|uniref:OFA family MFS transporter n=1 Tax=Polymorphobacter sp. PAMC 29334 TaxID=2862331 RepID=UPI001C66C6AF|nr:OFA family MFS transporter [Polymorphobacter sp. PAMC 29334]QYE35409.1 OFA family MFS transporter [Polymorphobacter sp. PAMC 29334]
MATIPATGWLDRAQTVAGPGFNRWLVPPCALAIHLCIGMAYGFSVFWLPLAHAIGIGDPVVCKGMSLATALTTTTCDWRVSDLVWTYTLFFVVLGAAAAIWGGWLERVGPRKAGVVAAFCWCGGMGIAAIGVSIHQLWLIWLGSGLIGGIGLGLGYISPVSTLIKWFPDRRGMATGMAIMGFGGGALIGSPLADLLMKHFASPTGVGVWQTFLVLAAGYFVFMMAGAIGYRVPPDRYAPAGWTPPETTTLSRFNVALGNAHRTPQFWLVWTVLFLNVSASIGIIGVASPMLQELFGGRLIGDAAALFTNFDASQKKAAATIGAGFVGIISLFNIGGRFFWAALSDRIGRKPLYAVMTALGAVLYGLAAPHFAGVSVGLFIVTFAVIASMYGGGFAAVPAYLADLFGTKYVGAIHGRLLTAWSCAGIAGPLLVAGMRDARIAEGVPRAEVYGPIYLILAAMLVVGFVANLAVRPVAAKWHMAEDTTPVAAPVETTAGHTGGASLTAILAWAAVGLPIAWGVYMAVLKAAVLLK